MAAVIVVNNLTQSANEKNNENVIKNKVESLVKDGLCVKNPQIKCAERKTSKNNHTGIDVKMKMRKTELWRRNATCKEKIIIRKFGLKNGAQECFVHAT